MTTVQRGAVLVSDEFGKADVIVFDEFDSGLVTLQGKVIHAVFDGGCDDIRDALCIVDDEAAWTLHGIRRIFDAADLQTIWSAK